jgi:hypothetical protein
MCGFVLTLWIPSDAGVTATRALPDGMVGALFGLLFSHVVQSVSTEAH